MDLMADLKYALKVSPDERYGFSKMLQDTAFEVAIMAGRKCVIEEDVVKAHSIVKDVDNSTLTP